MTKKSDNSNTRNFSSADSVLYNGALYPSSTVLMDNGNGIIKDSKIFMDNDGQYYTLGDNGMAYPVMLQHNLPEVEVKPSQEEMLDRSLKNSLTLSQDKARVSNPLNPHESFNNHLRERALRGANEHALWDKKHPNLASWRDFTTAIPFGVASIPLAGGLGDTALGQAALNGVGRVMANPIVETANNALGLGMAVEGAKDLKQGKLTPMTLLDLSGVIIPAKGITNAIDKFAIRGAGRAAAKRLPLTGNTPILDTEEVPLSTDISELRSRVDNLTSRVRSISEEHPELIPTDNRQPWDLPAELPNIEVNPNLSNALELSHRTDDGFTDLDRMVHEIPALSGNIPTSEIPADAFYNPTINMSDAAIQRAYTRIIRNVEEDKIRARNDGEFFGNHDSPLDFVTPRPNRLAEYMEQRRAMREARDAATTSFDNANNPFELNHDFSNSLTGANSEIDDSIIGLQPFKTRDLNAGEQPYTKEEIKSFINEDGTSKVAFGWDSTVHTLSHGDFYRLFDTPKDVLWKHLKSTDSTNPKGIRQEMLDIMKDNPTGRSGVLIKTKTGDTSIDSTPLAYNMATRLGKNFRPLNARQDRVTSNGFGYNNIFKESKTDADRARVLLESNPDAQVTLLKDAEGNMTGMQLTDENGDFIIPLRSRQEVLDIMNKKLHKFNEHYGTSYSDITPKANIFGEMSPWYFGERFDLPNIYGISYKKGGRLSRKRKGLLT